MAGADTELCDFVLVCRECGRAWIPVRADPFNYKGLGILSREELTALTLAGKVEKDLCMKCYGETNGKSVFQ